MRITQKRFAFLTLAAMATCLMSPGAQAQETSSTGAEQAADTTPPNAPQNPPGPVGGVEGYRLGGPTLGHSSFIPRLSLQEMYNTNPGYASTTGSSQSDSITSIGGGFDLQWMKRDSTLSVAYNANSLIYNSQTQPNGVIQQLALTEKVALRRWNLLFGENFSYLPSSAFGLQGLGFSTGYGGVGISGLPGTGGVSSFNPAAQPEQSIGSGNVDQISSSTVVQAQYILGPRSSLNGTGSVGFLHFFGNNLLNSRDVTARFGYDRSFTARDTISFSYLFSTIAYPSGIQGFYSQYIQVGYRRILTGRLLATVSVGPVISHFTSANGQTTVPGGQNAVNWSLFSGLDYRMRNGSLSAQYSHSVTGGSGFFAGAVTDQVTGNFSRQFSRVWSLGLNGGFARNNSFQQTTTTTVTTSGSTATYDYWFAGFSVARPLGHHSSVRFFYNASKQTGNTTTCVGGACAPIALLQVVGVTFNWSTRPYKLD